MAGDWPDPRDDLRTQVGLRAGAGRRRATCSATVDARTATISRTSKRNTARMPGSNRVPADADPLHGRLLVRRRHAVECQAVLLARRPSVLPSGELQLDDLDATQE
jgi:hypothetical protein